MSEVPKDLRQSKAQSSTFRALAQCGFESARTDVGDRIVKDIERMSALNATRRQVGASIEHIAKELLAVTFEHRTDQGVLLLPVLRAGLAMWGVANNFFESPESSFITGSKEKGTCNTSVLWPKRNSLEGKHLVVLEPIIATGDTLLRVHDNIVESPTDPASLTVLSCYASPEGIQKVLEDTRGINVVVGCVSESVDKDGYLIPTTNGDMGDKLFGKVGD